VQFSLDERKLTNAEIICVGTELLMGHTLNTNSAYLSRQLASIGIPSYRQVVIGDNHQRLENQIRESAAQADLLLFTGGLGPTADDITMEVAAKVAGIPLVYNEKSYQVIETYFKAVGRPVPSHAHKQTYLPQGAIVMPNTNGTASGAIFSCPAPTEKDPERICIFILMPGPPSEVVPMFEKSVFPILVSAAPFRFRSAFVRLIGIGEHLAEARIKDLINAQDNPTIAPYVSDGECMFRVTQRMNSDNDPDLLTPLLQELRERFGNMIYEIGERPLKQVVFDLLKQSGQTISFAESCTAGMISSELGDIPGASSVFMGSVVSYDNRIKRDVLGVREGTLKEHGAVSSECAIEMAEGARRLLQTDLSVSVTGIAGPDGGTKDKPVGLVYIALSDRSGSIVTEHNFAGNRSRVRRNAMLQAFDMIRMRLI
jgi:nicotinamide-nucleotide amidase